MLRCLVAFKRSAVLDFSDNIFMTGNKRNSANFSCSQFAIVASPLSFRFHYHRSKEISSAIFPPCNTGSCASTSWIATDSKSISMRIWVPKLSSNDFSASIIFSPWAPIEHSVQCRLQTSTLHPFAQTCCVRQRLRASSFPLLHCHGV